MSISLDYRRGRLTIVPVVYVRKAYILITRSKLNDTSKSGAYIVTKSSEPQSKAEFLNLVPRHIVNPLWLDLHF